MRTDSLGLNFNKRIIIIIEMIRLLQDFFLLVSFGNFTKLDNNTSKINKTAIIVNSIIFTYKATPIALSIHQLSFIVSFKSSKHFSIETSSIKTTTFTIEQSSLSVNLAELSRATKKQ